MTWRTLAALASALAIAGVAIALLAPNHGNAIDPVAQAAETTAAAGSAEFGLAGSMTFGGQTIPLQGNGVADMREQRGRMTISTAVPGMGSVDMQEIMDGTTFYMHLPAQVTQRLPGGKSWMKVDLQALGKTQGIDYKQLMQANRSTPSNMLQALRTAGSSHVVGQEAIGGAPTTHYAATIDLSKAADRIPDKQTVASLEQTFAQAGLSSFPIDVWVDRSGRVRRERMSLSGNQFGMQMTIEFTRFGVPVDTTPPPSDQVLDASAILGAAARTRG